MKLLLSSGSADGFRPIGIALGLLLVLALGSPTPVLALPLGTIGGPADSLLRVRSQGNECTGGGGVMCFESIGALSLADYSLDPDSALIAAGTVDHAAGALAGSLRLSPLSIFGFNTSGELNVHARDRFTLVGPAGGGPVTITAKLQVGGSVVASAAPDEVSVTVEALLNSTLSGWDSVNGGLASSTGSAGLFRMRYFPGDPFLTLLAPTPIDIEAVDTFDVAVGQEFQLGYRMRLLGSIRDQDASGGALNFNFLNTAQLSFDLPAGYSISSDLGFSATSVPEPATTALLAMGLLGAGWARRARLR